MHIGKFMIRRWIQGLVICSLPIALGGCVSVYSNHPRFDPPPSDGMNELEMLRKYGAPAFAGFVEDQKVYVFKIRDSQYLLGFGQFKGYDLVVTCKGGIVKNTERVPRGQTSCFLAPAPWIGMD